jgi:enamine deaminase RidA (YjgF/YER057c/UK114 family)
MNTDADTSEFVDVRLVEGERFALGFLTGRKDPTLGPEEAARSLFGDLADTLVRNGIRPVQEKVYGLSDRREEWLSYREAAYRAAGLDPGSPSPAYHMGRAGDAEAFRGVQIWGVVPKGDDVAVASVPGGRLWTGPDFRILLVPGIRGTEETGGLAVGETAQAERMFQNAAGAIEKHGFSFPKVSRTWIYLKHLLDWYGEFNRVRNAFFAEQGVGRDTERSFPASTGIQGTSAGEACSMDVLATEGSGVISEPLRKSNRQGSAADYGSSFSRAMSVAAGGLDMIFVSGTASIDPSGESIHIGDGEAQIRETLKCIADLLEIRGAGLKDIHLATVFGKTPNILDTYRKIVPPGAADDFPFVPVVADVCRDELLVEIEALAVSSPRAFQGTPPIPRKPRSSRPSASASNPTRIAAGSGRNW